LVRDRFATFIFDKFEVLFSKDATRTSAVYAARALGSPFKRLADDIVPGLGLIAAD
jgi:hypothetical protein